MFRYQYQMFRHDPENGIMGDCYRTAVACVLDKPIHVVPHSHEELTGSEMEALMDGYLNPLGLFRIYIPVVGDRFTTVVENLWVRGGGLPMLITGKSPRYDCNHVMVVYGPNDIWCPSLGRIDGGTQAMEPALPDGYYWVEWIVGRPTEPKGRT